MERADRIAEFLRFLYEAKDTLKQRRVSSRSAEVQQIRCVIEEHYVDDQGKPAMYQQFESALYDDAESMVTLWQFFDGFTTDQLERFQPLLTLEIEGLTGDRHPRKVFDRSPFGVAALVVGTVTIWMTFLRTYTGEDLSELLELIRFDAIAGTIWIVGMFTVVWYILKTHRNNHQVALLSSIHRAIQLYLNKS